MMNAESKRHKEHAKEHGHRVVDEHASEQFLSLNAGDRSNATFGNSVIESGKRPEEGNDKRIDAIEQRQDARDEHDNDRCADDELGHETGKARAERIRHQGFNKRLQGHEVIPTEIIRTGGNGDNRDCDSDGVFSEGSVLFC